MQNEVIREIRRIRGKLNASGIQKVKAVRRRVGKIKEMNKTQS